MRPLVLLIVLLAAALAGTAQAAPLTVVGFNVQSDNSSDRAIGRQLARSSDVDLWGLTEIYREGGWVEPLRVAAGVGEDADFGAVVGKTGNGNESLVIYRTGRLTLLGSEELTSVAAGSRDAAPLVARFRLDDQKEFLFLVLRLSTRDSTRLEQAGRLADWAATQTLPVIAVGTFAFEVSEGGTTGDEAMALLTSRTGWTWVRPNDAFATACGRDRLVQDFVFAGGAARDWAGQSAVMFKQSNYCSSGESNRFSLHRPVIAGFNYEGGPGGIVGVMPDRKVAQFQTEKSFGDEEPEAREEVSKPALVNEAGDAPSPVTASGSGALTPAPAAASATAPAAAPPPAAVSTPPAPAAAPAPVEAEVAPAPVEAEVAPAPTESADPERDALLERLEALEREAREIRRELEED